MMSGISLVMEQVTGVSIPAGIDRTMVDRTIASGFRLLKFPRRLEAAFELEVGRERCRQLPLGGLFGVLLFDLFVISDWLITPRYLCNRALGAAPASSLRLPY